MKAEEAYALSRKYTEDTIEGAGAVAGKPCQIQSITDITGGHRVTFLWLDNEGASHTSAMDVMDGAKGDKGDSGDAGLGIKSVAVNTEDHLIITYDDDTTQDAGQIQVMAAVDSVNGKTGDVVLGASDVGALPDDTDIPSKTSDLTNDSIVDSASYDSANHQILFKNGTTTLFSLDATAFVKDGMVDDVEISGGNLVITFNTDAGKQAISIPLTDIFDPANYYDKDDVDELLADKADKVASATNGDFAGLDANGNLTDSGKKASDFGTADEISDIVNVYGAKNLMETTASSHTQNGITKTVNADGSFTLNGTATDNTYFYWTRQTEFPTENIQYTYSIETSAVWGIGKAIAGIDKRSETAYIDRYKSLFADGTTHIEGTFTGESGYYAWAWIFIPNGTQLTDVIVKGMIRLASVKDNTYVPYAPTNAKLDEVKVSYTDASESVQKNLNSYPYLQTTKTVNGITFTDLGDGRVKVNGTATGAAEFFFHNRFNTEGDTDLIIPNGRYILTGCPSGGGTSTYELGANRTYNGANDVLGWEQGNGLALTLNGDDFSSTSVNLGISILIHTGATVNNLIFSPMLRKATIKDDTWAPYIPNNTELVSWKANGVLGAKNLISYPYYHTTRTEKGITWTVNGDGTVTANGTATELSQFMLHTRAVGELNDMVVPNGRYVFTGCPKGGTSSTYRVIMGCTKSNAYYSLGEEYGDGVEIVLNGDDFSANSVSLQITLEVRSGQTVNNLVFKPMLRLASDTDDTYQPYAMTNRGLTEKVNVLPREIFVTTDTRTTTTNDANTLPCGFTRMSDANSNLPTDGTGGNVWYDILTVRQSNDSSKETWGYGFQLAVQTTTNANMGDMYVRAVNGGATPTWGAWRKLN